MNTRRGFLMIIALIIIGIIALGAGIGVRYFIENLERSSHAGTSFLGKGDQKSDVAQLPTTPYSQSAVTTSSESDTCDSIPNQKAKYSCYTELALVVKDQALCLKIQDEYFRDKCAEIVVIAQTPIDPMKLAQARNVQRSSDVSIILNAIGQRTADNRGTFEMNCVAGMIPTTPTKISSRDGYNLMPCITPTYIYPEQVKALFDPSARDTYYASNTDYDTGYFIQKSPLTGQVSVSAPAAELGESIVATR